MGLLSSDANPAEAFLKARDEGDRICPALLDAEVHNRIDDLARRAHRALGCKYYSLYDVRIDDQGFPFMLEACLFCSFSPYSVIVSMAAKSSSSKMHPHPALFETFLRRAARETCAMREQSDGAVAVTGGVKRR